MTPLDWSDLNNWSQVTGLRLNHADMLEVKELSAVYCGVHSQSYNVDYPCPYPEGVDRKDVSSKVKNLLGSRKKKK